MIVFYLQRYYSAMYVMKNLMLHFILIFASLFAVAQVNINASVQINGFRHNHDCGNDGGFNEPDPRYRVWIGTDNANFNGVTSAPGIYGGCTDTYGADATFCSTWNPGIINAANILAQPINQINVDMESWEDDACGSNCSANTCGFPTFNSDDTRCGRLRIGDINFWVLPPCQNNTYTGGFTTSNFLSMYNRCSDNNGAGYGINQLIINWSFASAPTIVTQPTPYDRTLCLGSTTTLSVSVNSYNGWSLGRFYQWQVSTNTDCAFASGWTDIAGATASTYIPPQTPGTRLYRCLITSNCTANFSTQTVISNCVRVTYHPFTSPIVSGACGTSIIPGVPYSFCTTAQPNANASVNNTSFGWSVSPSAGVTVSAPTTSCTNITFSNSGAYTINLTYGDACGAADAIATCNTNVNAPSCDMIYVDATSGNNANLGYPTSPVQNLWKALQLVGGTRTNIRMTGGNYTEPNQINLVSNVVIDGRWLNSAGIWTKSSAVNTNLTFSAEETISSTTVHRVGIKAFSVSGWVLQDLNITTTNVTGTSTGGLGKSNYGILMNNCSNYTINRCALNVGNASSGSNGINGIVGTNGNSGANGNGGHCDNNTSNTLGGAGGTAAGSGTTLGGAGGAGGRGADYNSNNNAAGTNGNNGGSGASGGNVNGGAGASGGGGTDCNRDGRKGQNGTNGTAGTSASGVPPTTNSTFGTYWVANGSSASGADGGGGGGGEGGGGGGRQNCTFCDDGGGSAGGGGGSGGQGGTGGTGGNGGGGSFGIYRTTSTTGPLIQNITIILPSSVAAGGNGGNGGSPGGNGGSGGLGGGGNNNSLTAGGSTTGGRSCGNCEVGAGGQGGSGGNGGIGGNGQPGANGRNDYMITDGVVSNPSSSIPNPTTLVMSHPINGKGCVNSEIELSRASASTWVFSGAASYIDDISNTVSSFNNATSPTKIFYTANGIYDITTNGGTYEDWIRIIDNTRPATVAFSISSQTVCSGSPFTVSVPAWGTELAYDWALYTTNANTPLLTATSQTVSFTAPTVTTPTTYNIRYRVRENCCGWSRPYYTTVTVNPQPTPLAGADGWVCESSPYTLAAASSSNAASVSWSTSGNGTFNNNALVNAIYTPGSSDISTGTVSLTINSTALFGCTNASDQIVLTVIKNGTWLGLVNTPVNDNWNNSVNWCGGIPTQVADAIIPTTPIGPFWPTIGALDAEVRDLTLQNGSTLTYYQNNQLDVYRDFNNNGSTINLNQGKTRFTGGLYNGGSFGTSSTNFYDLIIDKTSGTKLVLNQNATAYNNLNMITGDIDLMGPTVLELGTSPVSLGSLSYTIGTSGSILGRFKRWFSSSTNSGLTGLFPVGVDISGIVFNRWSRVDYTNAPNPGGSLTMRFVLANPLFYANLPLNDAGQILNNLYNDGYWEATAGGGLGGTSLGNYDITLRANGFAGVAYLPSLRLIKSPPPHVVWTLDGSHMPPTPGTVSDVIIARTGLTGFSWFTIASDHLNILPIELYSFNAGCNNGEVNINWVTASEHNNAQFIVERSENGYVWQELTRVNGAGNSNTIKNYDVVDTKPLNENSYYRIRQVDFNGEEKIFMSSVVSCKYEGDNSIISYPNPATDHFVLELNLKNNASCHIEITDALGRTLKTIKKIFKEGKNIFVLQPLSEFANGLYYVKILSDDVNLPIQKMVISK
jgi:hypothetical protein